MAKLVTIFGGSGFLGRYIARRFAKAGWRVRAAVRRPDEAGFLRTYGQVGQVEPVLANIRDEGSTAQAIEGAEVVINCVGILNQLGENRFESIHAESAGRVAQLSAEAEVERFIHISSIGADEASLSEYSRTKAEGEKLVREAIPEAFILRPSIIFGIEDSFFNRFAKMARMSPALPVVGGKTLFQPVYVDDVAEFAMRAALGECAPDIYELGGPEQLSFEALMKRMLEVIQRRRLIIGMPFWQASIMASGLDLVQKLSFGLIENQMLTLDQVQSLRSDNIVAEEAKGFDALGITPKGMDVVLPEYLWVYRPSGQFARNRSEDNL